MIQHHNGALTMVKDLFDTAGAGQDAELFNFATDADNTQRVEIRIMETMFEKRNARGETMNRLPSLALCVVWVALIFSFAVNRTQAQAQPPAPPQEQAQKPATPPSEKEAEDEEENLFVPEKAPTLPPGMTGSDANDPRAKLAPGLYDAGEAAMGIEHILLLKKPDAFQLGTADPDDPKVETMVGGSAWVTTRSFQNWRTC